MRPCIIIITNATIIITILRSVQKLVILNIARFLILLQMTLALFRVIGSAILGLPVKGANLRPTKAKTFPWLNRKELRRYFITILKMTGVKGKDYKMILQLIPIIQKHWKDSGIIWISKYWAEVFRYIVSYLNGESLVDKKLWVKRTRKGLPHIIPLDIRNLVSKFKHSNVEIQKELSFLIKSLLSCLNFYRAVSGHHTVKLDSITTLHKGSVKSFSYDILRKALRRLKVRKITRLESPRYFLPSKSGVNGNLVFVSVGYDFIALMLSPRIFLGHIKWCIHYHYYYHLVLMFMLFILLSPIAIIVFIIQSLWIDELDRLHLGRLSIVKEARQKARVVGITDWWTQVLFKPLHDEISNVLKFTPEDGTFDQHRPVKSMLYLAKSKAPIVSSDLSAATDRLPVSIQKDILTVMGVPGQLWEDILNRPYFVQEPKPQMVEYAVGQPMGVYSSFVMLALTNHVLNMIAVDMTPYGSVQEESNIYSVLGDDQASRDEDQAKAYTTLLTLLGVEVNPIKGFKGNVCEFAKRLYFRLDDLSFMDISPLGAKVVLRASRNPYFVTALLSDMITKSYTLNYAVSLLSNYLSALFHRGSNPQETCVLQLIYLLVLLGPQSGLYDLSKPISDGTPQGVLKAEFERLLTTFKLDPSSYFEFFSLKALDKWAQPNDLLVVANTFVSDLWKVNLNSGDYFFKADYLLRDRTGLLTYIQVLMTTLLASIISYPIMVTKLCREYMNFLILEFSTRNTVQQSDGHQLDIIKSVTKGLSPQSFKDLNILDKIDMTMFGRIPFLVLAKPINVILSKVTASDVIDQMPAHKLAVAFIKDHNKDLYKSYLNYIKRVNAAKKNGRKFRSSKM